MIRRLPKTFEECLTLLHDAEFDVWLKTRLVMLASDTSTTVAVKAIEMLMASPRLVDDLGLGGVDRMVLETAEAAAEAKLRELAGDGRGIN